MNSAQEPEPSWRPDPAEAENTILAAFTRWVAAEHELDLPDYDTLWRWSVEHLDDFWLAVWRYFGLQSEPGPSTVLASTAMPGAAWFPGVRLNYVTHVFRDRDPDRTAVVELTETGASTEVTWGELERQVGAAAATLRRLGVGQGDRVVGYVPNNAAAIVAFLATASLGAIWSCCGPDYAAEAAANRLAQLEPTVLVAADGYHFAGQTHDRRDEAVRLTTLLPTWYLVPFAIVAVLGLIGGSVLDIYSSGLALLTLGVRIPRYAAALVDGTVMTAGTIYVVFFADNFIGQFEGFLTTLGVPIAAWCGIMLADIALRKRDYADADLYSASGRYGDVRWIPVLTILAATAIGWGLVTNSSASWLTWQGYLLGPFGLGGKTGAWAYANLGVLVALAIGFVVTALFSRSAVRAEESVPVAAPAAAQA